jgi:hypothetical protein
MPRLQPPRVTDHRCHESHKRRLGRHARAVSEAGPAQARIRYLLLATSRAPVRRAPIGTGPETASRSPCSLSPRCERRGAGPPRARLGRQQMSRPGADPRPLPSVIAEVGGARTASSLLVPSGRASTGFRDARFSPATAKCPWLPRSLTARRAQGSSTARVYGRHAVGPYGSTQGDRLARCDDHGEGSGRAPLESPSWGWSLRRWPLRLDASRPNHGVAPFDSCVKCWMASASRAGWSRGMRV